MKLRGDWRLASETVAVMRMLEEGGHQAWFVGGCVRNDLLGVPVSDIDIATDARPETVVRLAEAAGLKPVPTGIDHGTVTVVSGHVPHEVTTFRRDVETDGRRAVVAYSNSIAEDAARRDFTMNALYAGLSGRIEDPVGGLADLAARRVRFIGDAVTRIAEDGLRILRFFRFHAHYGDPQSGLDPEGLAAVAASLDRIAPVSRERIGAELAKLLSAADPAPAVAAMAASGVLARVLPGADPRPLGPLVHLEQVEEISPRWQRRLAVLGGVDWQDALRLSRADLRLLDAIRAAADEAAAPAAAAYRHGADAARDGVLVAAASLGGAPPAGWRTGIAAGAAARFPVRAADLIDRHGETPALGAALKRLEQVWIDSGFALDRDALLAIDKRGGAE